MATGSDRNLDDLTVSELRELAQEHDITGRSTMRKEELRQAVEDAEEQTSRMQASSSSASAAKEQTSKETSSEETSSKDDSSSTEGDEITAPSVGPNTVIEHVPPEERIDEDKISDVDAMGLDKRRQVAGKRYGASPAKQAVVYGTFLVVLIALVIGGKILTDKLDKGPDTIAQEAPWTGTQKAPARIDFPETPDQ